MKKILLTVMSCLLINMAHTQMMYSTNGYESMEWNDYTKEFGEATYHKENLIFQFYDDYTKFNIISKPVLDWTVVNSEVNGNVITFTGLDSSLEECLIIIDYDKDLIKLMFNLDGNTYLIMYNIVSYKKY